VTQRTLDPPSAPPDVPRDALTFEVPDPIGRGNFRFRYRLVAGLIGFGFAACVVAVIGALTDWRQSSTVLVVEGTLILALTAVSEGFLKAAY
jgi:hypothetical protein